ncbi:DNA-binding domain-containing protein [Paraburkholderia sp. J76]|uniref:HvfC/BufC N-terminal domain-containing protein n=1 Tax=Paraburkholderia sp. J76 TaxID=2805439 RepID=UPI002ABDE66D|nr:DNA-binding domain-containing protein [Paraburkholderia sp. J76]
MTLRSASRMHPRASCHAAHRARPHARCPRDRQKDFAAALLDPAMPIPRGLVGPDGKPDAKRFNVYRNNVFTGLIDALKAAFPAVRRIVGDEFFTAMARIHVALDPPGSPVMLEYGHAFAGFIETFEPAQSVPYLADVARLERAWAEAYHAAEPAPGALAALGAMGATGATGAIEAQRLAHARFALHPSLRVVRSTFPVVDLWRMNIDGGVPAAIDVFGGGQHALVVRPHAEVEVRRMTEGAATFVQRLAAGDSIAAAASLAQDDDPGFDLARAPGDLFATGAIVGWKLPDNPDVPRDVLAIPGRP